MTKGIDMKPLGIRDGISPLGLKVLVLEDEMVIAVLMEDLLAELGCEVVGTASSVSQALELADNTRPDAALLDLHLRGGESGYAVADVLAERDVPFAFVTGYSADMLRPPHDGRPVLEKPFWTSSLASVLRDLATPAN
jgi:CheY-like chemotaxis protein